MANRVSFNPNLPDITESDALYARAIGLIPAGTQTLAKGVGQFSKGVAPKFLVRGRGARVWDVDGNEYLDLQMGVGPISLGYAYPRVDEAIQRQLRDGITFSLIHPLEVEVAELIRAQVPNAECVRYSKTGAEVTSAAVRLARAHTGRDKVLCCGYHGWHDWYVAVTDRAAGVPSAVRELTHTFGYNDLGSLERSLDADTACVILEPVVFEPPAPGFLEGVRDLCTARGALLVFDEMWTGFRLAPGGAQQHFAVTADLACFSKACANGMPLSILTGRREVMKHLEREVFFFTTFGGEALSLAACQATISEIVDREVTDQLWRLGIKLKDSYNQLTAELGVPFTHCVGLGPRTMITFDPSAGPPLVLKTFVQQELLRRGILWSGFHNLSFSHSTDDLGYLVRAYREVLGALRDAVRAGNVEERLEGEVLQPILRKTADFNTRPIPVS